MKAPMERMERRWWSIGRLVVVGMLLFIMGMIMTLPVVECLSSSGGGGGPKATTTTTTTGRQRRTTVERRPRNTNSSSSSGPKQSSSSRRRSTSTTRMRRSSSSSSTSSSFVSPVIFDAKLLTEGQTSNEEEAWILDLTDKEEEIEEEMEDVIQFYALNDVFGIEGLSEAFCSKEEFREGIRNAIRQDIFHSTPAYANLSPKAMAMLLHPDSSLQGSWNCHCMERLTKVLHDANFDTLTGEEFMNGLGALCHGVGVGDTSSKAAVTYHWMDIIGVKDRMVSHSWHQDTALMGEQRTVMLGFPCVNDYDGTGVFSHAVKLRQPRIAPPNHPPNEPLLYTSPPQIPDNYIIRPRFAVGKEIMVYPDTHILHSAPDVTYRSSVMRFM